ncbi:MAG: manganese efflux pump MntP family protein [bacterium]|nr:manganese efflux pump MntP family protein [bacterium]
MNTLTIFVIALGLAMDAFAVSITSGIAIKRLRIRYALRIAFFFGAFQALMPIIGWFAGLGMRDLISAIDHWIAFILLLIVGCKMIYESTVMDEEKDERDPLNLYVLIVLSVATSIDALAVGLSLSFINVAIIAPAAIIGVITFLLSFLGVYIGDRFGHFFESRIEILGGLILIGIGTRILIEHTA